MDHTEISKALFAAFARGDTESIRRLCAPDMQARKNNDAPISLDALISSAAAVIAAVPDFEYGDPVRGSTPTGFVEEHQVRGTLPDGRRLDAAVCVVCDVKDGRVTALREYFDPAAAAGLAEALGAG